MKLSPGVSDQRVLVPRVPVFGRFGVSTVTTGLTMYVQNHETEPPGVSDQRVLVPCVPVFGWFGVSTVTTGLTM